MTLFSLTLFGFILSLSNLDADDVAHSMSGGFPSRATASYFIIVAVFLSLVWLGLVAYPSLTWIPPAGLESAITMVIQALDLGVIVPISLGTAILLLKKRSWGYVLSMVLLLKILTMGAALIAMIIGQMLAGIAVDPVTSIIFTLISLSGIILGMVTLKNVGGEHVYENLGAGT